MPVSSSRQRPRTTSAYRAPSPAARRPQRSMRGDPRSGLRRRVAPKKRTSVMLGMISIASFVLFFAFLMIAVGQLFQSVQNQDMNGMAGAARASLLAFIFPFLGLATGGIGCFLPSQNRVLAGIGAALNGVLLIWVISNSVGGARARAATACLPHHKATTASISTRPPLGSAATCTVARAG